MSELEKLVIKANRKGGIRTPNSWGRGEAVYDFQSGISEAINFASEMMNQAAVVKFETNGGTATVTVDEDSVVASLREAIR